MPKVNIHTDRGAMDVIADVYGVFAVHPTIHGMPGQYQLTHLPSGWSYLDRVSYEHAIACAQEVNASGLDWSGVHGQDDLTPEHKAQGRAMRERYPSDGVVHIQRRGEAQGADRSHA